MAATEKSANSMKSTPESGGNLVHWDREAETLPTVPFYPYWTGPLSPGWVPNRLFADKINHLLLHALEVRYIRHYTVGRISDGNEEAYMGEVDRLGEWPRNYLAVHLSKTKKTSSRGNTHLSLQRLSFEYLGIYISEDVSWAQHIDAVIKKRPVK